MKAGKVSKDIKRSLAVFAEGQHVWAISEPDKEGLRTIYLDGDEEGKGILLGSVRAIALGYMRQSSDIEIGRQIGIEFPGRPKSNCVLISTPVTAILLSEGAEVT